MAMRDRWINKKGYHADIKAVRSELPDMLTLEDYLQKNLRVIGIYPIRNPRSDWPTGIFIEPVKNQKLADDPNRHSLWLNTQVCRRWHEVGQVDALNGGFVLFDGWDTAQNTRQYDHWRRGQQ